MKKVFVFVVVGLLALLILVQLALPSRITVAHTAGVPVSRGSLAKLLTDRERWEKWWPAASAWQYPSQNFSVDQQLAGQALLQQPIGDTALTATLQIASIQVDSSALLIQTAFPATANPFKKIRYYLAGQNIKTHFDRILTSLKTFSLHQENVYGLTIREEKVKDSTLIAIKTFTTSTPHPALIYGLVAELKAYARSQGAGETNFPMLNQRRTEDGTGYEIMVALPVDKALPRKGAIEPKRLVLGKILVAEVQGGPKTVETALAEMERYLVDYHRSSPAIPFESLVTNRAEEGDTSKWITKLYYPVF